MSKSSPESSVPPPEPLPSWVLHAKRDATEWLVSMAGQYTPRTVYVAPRDVPPVPTFDSPDTNSEDFLPDDSRKVGGPPSPRI
jgi:hypothetical protein